MKSINKMMKINGLHIFRNSTDAAERASRKAARHHAETAL